MISYLSYLAPPMSIIYLFLGLCLFLVVWNDD
jgi:hypothetical protein